MPGKSSIRGGKDKGERRGSTQSSRGTKVKAKVKAKAWKSPQVKKIFTGKGSSKAVVENCRSLHRMKDPSKGTRYPRTAAEANAAGYAMRWETTRRWERDKPGMNVRLPARGVVKHDDSNKLQQSIALVSDGRLTAPGELLARVVAGMTHVSCMRSRYKARLLATGAVRMLRGELRLALYEPWMLGLPDSFHLLGADAQRQVIRGGGSNLNVIITDVANLRANEKYQQVAFSSNGWSAAFGKTFKLPPQISRLVNAFLQPSRLL